MDTKRCCSCKEEKPLEHFSNCKTLKDGKCKRCKDCANQANREYAKNNKETLNEKNREYRKRVPEKRRAWQIKTLYGLSKEDYESILEEQDGKCANPACSREATSVDHDHETGEIRGLLCRKCNSALGLLDDKPEMVEGLEIYINRRRE